MVFKIPKRQVCQPKASDLPIIDTNVPTGNETLLVDMIVSYYT